MSNSQSSDPTSLSDVQSAFDDLSAAVDTLNGADPDNPTSLDPAVSSLWSASDALAETMFVVVPADEEHPTPGDVYQARAAITSKRDDVAADIAHLVAHPNDPWDALKRDTKRLHVLTNGPGGVTDRRREHAEQVTEKTDEAA